MQSVASVPHPPLLVPELGCELPSLLGACDAAVADLLITGPRVVVCVGGGDRETRHPEDAWGTFAGYGADVTAGPGAPHTGGTDLTAGPGVRPGMRGGPSLPLSLTIGRWLLDRAGWAGPVICQEVPSGAAGVACRQLGQRLAEEVAGDFGPASAWLVLADGDRDGTARQAFATAGPARLLDVADGVEGRAAWQCLAGAANAADAAGAAGAVRAVGAHEPVRAEIRYDAEPFDVPYLVATWWMAGWSQAPRPLVAVVGPTATGKSDLGLALALALDGEVVNADALQLYRGMDVGTAKLPPAARRGVPHHLLDVLDVDQEASLAAYQRDARAAVAGIRARGRLPVLVGGSGLYVRAVLDRLEIPPTDPAVRARLEAEAARTGPGAMHRRLAEADPAAAAAILPGNVRRVVRALEVLELTGRPFAATMPARQYAAPAVQVGLWAGPEGWPDLDARIARRVDRMWAEGLVEETRRLLGRGLREGRTAGRAIGYAQVVGMLDGELDGATAREQVVTATSRLARRQQSWFRADPRVQWLRHDAADLLDQALAITAAAAAATAAEAGRP